MSTISEKIQYWLDIASYDLETAKVMLRGRRYLYVGFMCHQVVEKTLKAYYWFKKEDEPPYTHNLMTLAKRADLYEIFSEEQKDILDILTPINVQARYPDEKDEWAKSLSRDRGKYLLKKTKELFEWIKLFMKR